MSWASTHSVSGSMTSLAFQARIEMISVVSDPSGNNTTSPDNTEAMGIHLSPAIPTAGYNQGTFLDIGKGIVLIYSPVGQSHTSSTILLNFYQRLIIPHICYFSTIQQVRSSYHIPHPFYSLQLVHDGRNYFIDKEIHRKHYWGPRICHRRPKREKLPPVVNLPTGKTFFKYLATP